MKNILKQKNSKKQGDVGLGIAIAYFCMKGYTINIPLTDSQPYDLIIDKNGNLDRVQIKTCSFKTKFGIYTCYLSTKGGNKSFNTVKLFDNSLVDSVFIITDVQDYYWIPSNKLENTTSVNLGEKYKKFKLT